MSINLTNLVNQLRAILGKMEVALGAIADAIVWTGSDGKIQWCNTAFDKLVNQPHILVLNAKLSNLLFLSLAGEAVAPESYPNMRVLGGEDQITEEFEFHDSKHRSLILEISANCVEIAGGDRSSILVIRDVTQAKHYEAERYLAQQKQAETLSLLQATLESTADGIIVVNQDFNVAVFNQKFIQMWSIPESLLLPSQSNERFKFMSEQTRDPEAFIARVKELFYEYPEQEACDLVEMKDGRVFERFSQPQWKVDKIIGRVWSFRDITARQQVEKALSESEIKFRRIVENSNDIISLIDLEGRISYISPNLAKLTGYDTTELEGIPFADFLHPDDLPSCLDAVNRVVTTGERLEVEYRARLKDGSWQWQATNLATTNDLNGNLVLISVARVITERKQAEKALLKSEQKFRHLFENSQFGILRSRIEDGLILDANQRLAELLGYSCVADLIGGTKFTTDFYANPSDRQRIITELRQKGSLNNFELQFNRCDGKQHWGLFSLRLNLEDNCLEAVVADINDRKQAEEALRRSEQKYRNIFENFQVGIARIRLEDGLFLEANQRQAEILGYSSATDLIGKQFTTEFYANPNDRQQLLAEMAQQGEVRNFELQLCRRDKSLGWGLLSLRRNAEDDCIDAVITDISDRKLVEESLRQSEARFRALYESTSIAVMLQENGIPLDCNRAAQELFGYSRQEFLQKHPSEFSPPFQPNGQTSASLAREKIAIAYEQGRHRFEWVHRRADGTDFPAEVWLTVFKLGDRTLIQGVVQDLTERKQVEATLRIAKETAETANRSKSAFLANMSHELRTPLNAILGFAQLMERDTTLSKRQRDSLATINRSGEHLLNLINDVLEMSKIEAGRIVLNPTSFDLHRLLQEMQQMFQVRAKDKNLSLSFELAPDLHQYIFTDENKLRQVLINLLGNAIKFTNTGKVTLRVKPTKDHPENSLPNLQSLITFEIEDTGLGIPNEELDNLFQPFVQTTSARQVREGTGLGLTISRQFVQLMGGDIRVQSVVGRGSTFYFDIKIELADSLDIAPPTLKRKVIALTPGQPIYRILVVDDRQDNCDLLTQLFNTIGFETQTAANGQEAIAVWQTWEPHLIFMDMRMPVMDGYEATKQIRATLKGQATVIIALTASAFDEERFVVLSAGCNDFVRKPFREEVILNIISKYLGVRYVYEQEPLQKDQFAENSNLKFLSLEEILAQMPTEWVTQLHQAALRTDEKLIFSLLEQIPEESALLANTLSDWVNNFRIDKVIDLTQPDERI
ncbi:MAG: PAS domain S-box protein [Nostoc sp. DedQUE12a]|nr:PAS domain S-box protein [Nostoc sp. DedQUE12a]